MRETGREPADGRRNARILEYAGQRQPAAKQDENVPAQFQRGLQNEEPPVATVRQNEKHQRRNHRNARIRYRKRREQPFKQRT